LFERSASVDTENQIIIQRVIHRYLAEPDEHAWTIQDAYVSARTAGNRFGLPPDARTIRYLVEHPGQGWAVSVRAVWRSGTLMQPVAVHTTIERYFGDDDDLEAARVKANDWLRSLPL
jgi:hypothetical protein